MAIDSRTLATDGWWIPPDGSTFDSRALALDGWFDISVQPPVQAGPRPRTFVTVLRTFEGALVRSFVDETGAAGGRMVAELPPRGVESLGRSFSDG